MCVCLERYCEAPHGEVLRYYSTLWRNVCDMSLRSGNEVTGPLHRCFIPKEIIQPFAALDSGLLIVVVVVVVVVILRNRWPVRT